MMDGRKKKFYYPAANKRIRCLLTLLQIIFDCALHHLKNLVSFPHLAVKPIEAPIVTEKFDNKHEAARASNV